MAKKLDFKIMHRTTVQDFINSIYLDHDDDTLFALIAGLDEACSDWDFTERCRDHFVRQMEIKEAEEEAELEASLAAQRLMRGDFGG